MPGRRAARSISSATSAVRDAAAGVGADVDRHAGLVARPGPPRRTFAQRRMCSAYAGELLLPRRGDAREVLDVDHRRDEGGAAGGHLADAGPRSARCRARRSRCRRATRPGSASVPKVCAVTRAPAACAAAIAAASDVARATRAPGRRRRGRSSRRPASPSRRRGRPARSPRRPGRRADLDADVGHVAARAARCAGRPGPAAAGPGSSSSARVSTGEPQSRSASTPGLPVDRAPARAPRRGPRRARRRGAMPTWQCASTRPGQQAAAAATVSRARRPARRSPGRRAPTGRGARPRAAPPRTGAAAGGVTGRAVVLELVEVRAW